MSMDLTPEQDTEQEAAEQGTPFYKTKAGIGAISAGVIVVAAAAFFAFTGGSDKDEAPDPVATASMAPIGTPSPSTSGAPSASADPTGIPEGIEGTAGDGDSDASGPEPSPAAQQPSEENPAAVPGANGPIRVGDHAQGPSIGDWEPTAEAYGAAWADPSGGHAAWLERLKPHITPEMYMSFTYTDIANITARDLKYVIIADEGVRTKDFKIHYEDGYALLAQAEIQNDGTWRVSKSLPVER